MLALIYPATLILCLQAGGYWCWALLPLNIALVPLIDHLLQAWRPALQLSEASLARLFHPIWFVLYALAQSVALALAFALLPQLSADPLQFFGLVSGVGIMTGTGGITAAHELMHQRARWARGLGQYLLACTCYMHFATLHLRSHHRLAATPDDIGTAQLGESFPRYFSRVLRAGMREAWRVEACRLARRDTATLHPANRLLQSLVLQLLICILVTAGFGLIGLSLLLLQSFIAVHLLEAVNYVQHYGLRRRQLADGSAARISTRDAWDSDYRLSELMIFNLPRHADHHAHAHKACHQLLVAGDSPKLPYSFFLMVFLALLPPIWHRLMDPLARAQHCDGAKPAPAARYALSQQVLS